MAKVYAQLSCTVEICVPGTDLDYMGHHKGWLSGICEPNPICHCNFWVIKEENYIIPFQIQELLYGFLMMSAKSTSIYLTMSVDPSKEVGEAIQIRHNCFESRERLTLDIHLSPSPPSLTALKNISLCYQVDFLLIIIFSKIKYTKHASICWHKCFGSLIHVSR